MLKTEKDKVFEKVLEAAYNNCKFEAKGWNYETCYALESFHMQEVYMVEREDDYFRGIRADHFCVELGWTEDDPLHDKDFDKYTYCVVTANHKGQLRWCMFNLD